MTTASRPASIKHCTTHDVDYRYPFKCPRCEDEAKRDRERKFPHAGMEARYQHTRNVMFIMIGGDDVPFAKSQFFCGWTPLPASLKQYDPIMFAGKQMPTFATASEEGTVQPVMYVDREQAHAAMTLLLNWYNDIGKDIGLSKPVGLCIGF